MNIKELKEQIQKDIDSLDAVYNLFERLDNEKMLSYIDGLIYALVTAGTFGWLWP